MTEKVDFNQHLNKFNKINTKLDSLKVKIEEESFAFVGKSVFFFWWYHNYFFARERDLEIWWSCCYFVDEWDSVGQQRILKWWSSVHSYTRVLVEDGDIQERSRKDPNIQTFKIVGSKVQMLLLLLWERSHEEGLSQEVVRTIAVVRHVPSIKWDPKRNLISLATLDASGYRYSSQDGALKVSKGAIVLKGEISRGLYKLVGNVQCTDGQSYKDNFYK